MRKALALLFGGLFIAFLVVAASGNRAGQPRFETAIWLVVAATGGLAMWILTQALKGLVARCPRCQRRMQRQPDEIRVRPTRKEDGRLARIFACPQCDYQKEQEVAYVWDHYIRRHTRDRGRGTGSQTGIPGGGGGGIQL